MSLGILLLSVVFVRSATVEHHLTVQRGSWRVDSATANSSVVLVNSQFPGPTLEAVVGDDVVVHVQNALSEGTTVHFHGLLQRGTAHMDGVPYGTQCLIAPGATFTYRFKADSVGTFWYHSHIESHFVEGLYGAFVIRASAAEKKDDELLLILSDWYHDRADEVMRKLMTPPFATPIPDAVLINGLGGNTMAELHMRANTTYRVRVINAGAISLFRLAIEQHNITVIEADAHGVMPFATSEIEIDAGQRYVFLLKSDAQNGMVMINVEMMHRTGPSGHAMLMTDDMTGRKRQHAGHVTPTAPGGTNSVADEMPFERMLMAATSVKLPAVTKRLNFTVQRMVDSGEWHINDMAMPREPMTPLLHSVLSGEKAPSSVQIINLALNDVVEITWRNKRDTAGESEHHPMHIHGHRFWLLGSGTTGEPQYNVADQTMPLLRDTFHLPHEDGWAITRFVADNAGVWMVHCHYAWHMSSGMALYFVYQPVSSLPSLPADTQRCSVAFTERSTVPAKTPAVDHNQHTSGSATISIASFAVFLALIHVN